jgi:hypothetical protein
MNKNSNPTYRPNFKSPNWIYNPKTAQQWLKRDKEYQLDITDPHNSWNKCTDVEGLTAKEISLYSSKVENLEATEQLE